MRLKALAVALGFLFFPVFLHAHTLKDLILNFERSDPKELEKAVKNLTESDKKKLEYLYLLLAGDKEKAKQLEKELFSSNVILNALLTPKGKVAVVVDKTREVLYVVSSDDKGAKTLARFPCSTGKRPGDKLREGDLRTPEGIYFALYWSAKVNSTYGIGAFPLNYPNLIDRKILRRNGHGIWIHGTNQPKKEPHSTNGCIVLSNPDLLKLKTFIRPRETPIIIVSDLSYAPSFELVRERKSLLEFVNKWKKAWENSVKNIEDYLSLYSKKFVWKNGGYREWVRYKKRITRRKRWIKVKISNLYLSKDGRLLAFGNLYVASFDLIYRSNNFSSKDHKILYIIRENGKWKILAEENL